MKKILSLVLTLATLVAFSNDSKASSYDELCDRYLPEGADRMVLHGKDDDSWKYTKFGDTKSFLEGRKSHYYINLHNGIQLLRLKDVDYGLILSLKDYQESRVC